MNTLNSLPIKKALISVYDKRFLGDLVTTLQQHQVEIYATSGTQQEIKKHHIESLSVESLTSFSSLLDGRVKTLHPAIFAGILARKNNKKDMDYLLESQLPAFDLVVVNLYPFLDHSEEDIESQSEWVDIGGVSLIRAAAKNFHSVVVITDPSDYERLVNDSLTTSLEFRREMALRAFSMTSQYDASIFNQWQGAIKHCDFPPAHISFTQKESLRYGENPHQKAVWCSESVDWRVLSGKKISYNNIADGQVALSVVSEFKGPAVSVIKHQNPCGVASIGGISSFELGDQANIFSKAIEADKTSSFGGIVASNMPLNRSAAEVLKNLLLEVVIAPSFSKEAKEILSNKQNLRLVEYDPVLLEKERAPSFEIKKAMGGWLLQTTDPICLRQDEIVADWEWVSDENKKAPFSFDLLFSFLIVKHVRSNAIVIVKDGVTLGISGGQTNRLEAIEIALKKAKDKALSLEGAVLASDGFLPFRDNIDCLKGSGIKCVIQPGGSIRDKEVAEACKEQGVQMVLTHRRHFKH